MLLKPFPREPRHLFKRAWFFKKMGGMRNHRQRFFAYKPRVGVPVQTQHFFIPLAYDQQRRRGDIA